MKVFLSYRRSDTQGTTGRIFDILARRYGDKRVFMDVDDIPFGVDFREHIRKELSQCGILLAIIGPRWFGESEHRRIHDEDDFVRIEVETALQSGVWVVPVLVDGAAMPQADQLPESLRDLVFLNA